MRSLARYAVTNAVTRAMLSRLLTRADYEMIARATSVREAWGALRRTEAGAELPEEARTDPLYAEVQVRTLAARQFARATRQLRGRARAVGELLLSRWELDVVETALRLWHGGDPSLDALLQESLPVHAAALGELVNAQSVEEAALALRGTPYLDPLTAGAAKYKERGSVLYLEVALERDYYARLLAATRALGGMDARQGERVVGGEIDMLNLAWAARLMAYHDMTPAGLAEFMVPGPSALSRRLSSPGLAPGDIETLGAEALPEPVRREFGGLPPLERLSLLEHAVTEMSAAAARDALAGYPFSIAGVFAFYMLKRVEMRNLVTVFAGIACGLSDMDLTARLAGTG